MNIAHTPGPWFVTGVFATEVWAGNDVVAQMQTRGKESDEALERNEANARLIAAAPDLLKTAQLLIAYATAKTTGNDFAAWHGCSAAMIGEVLNDARAAIAKVQLP